LKKRVSIKQVAEHAGHVEGGHPGHESPDGPQPGSTVRACPGVPEDLVLGEEPGQTGDAGDRVGAHQERPEGDRHVLTQVAHLPHVELAMQRVHHRAGGHEQQRLEERVRHEVEHTHSVGAHAAGQEHVAELRDGGVGEYALDVVLHHGDRCRHQRGQRANHRYGGHRGGRQREQHVRAHDHVDAGGDHGGGVNERADRRGAFHGVGQPDVQRELGALAAGPHHEQQTNSQGQRAAGKTGQAAADD